MAHHAASEFAGSVRKTGLGSACAYLQSSAPQERVCYNRTAGCKAVSGVTASRSFAMPKGCYRELRGAFGDDGA
jgi:hypothetical protein